MRENNREALPEELDDGRVSDMGAGDRNEEQG